MSLVLALLCILKEVTCPGLSGAPGAWGARDWGVPDAATLLLGCCLLGDAVCSGSTWTGLAVVPALAWFPLGR